MKTKVISINIEENLLSAIDNICEEYSRVSKTKYTRSQFFTESAMFLIAASQQKHSEENNIENKEEK